MVCATQLADTAPAQYQMVANQTGEWKNDPEPLNCEMVCGAISNASGSSSSTDAAYCSTDSTPSTPHGADSYTLPIREDEYIEEAVEGNDSCFSDDDLSPPRFERSPSLCSFSMYNENYAQEWSDQQDNSEWQVPCMMLVPVANDQGEVQDTHYFPFSSSINDSGANGDGATANKDESDPISAKTRKDVMKLRKKLREIERIKERLEDGGKVDSFQMAKLEKREEILADIARLEEQDNGKAVDAGDGYFFDGMTVGVNEETADAESQWLGQAYAIMDNDAGQAPWMMWAPIAGADLDAQQNDIQEGVFFS